MEIFFDSASGNGKFFYYDKNIKRIKGEVYYWEKYVRNETSLIEKPSWARPNFFFSTMTLRI